MNYISTTILVLVFLPTLANADCDRDGQFYPIGRTLRTPENDYCNFDDSYAIQASIECINDFGLGDEFEVVYNRQYCKGDEFCRISGTTGGAHCTSPSPANNDCETAEQIALSEPITGTIIGATPSQNIFGLGVDTEGPTVWYSFRGTGETIKLQMDCGETKWDATVRVVGGGCNQYNGAFYTGAHMCEEGVVLVGIWTQLGQDYVVMVEDYSDTGSMRLPGQGDFTMTIELS